MSAATAEIGADERSAVDTRNIGRIAGVNEHAARLSSGATAMASRAFETVFEDFDLFVGPLMSDRLTKSVSASQQARLGHHPPTTSADRPMIQVTYGTVKTRTFVTEAPIQCTVHRLNRSFAPDEIASQARVDYRNPALIPVGHELDFLE